MEMQNVTTSEWACTTADGFRYIAHAGAPPVEYTAPATRPPDVNARIATLTRQVFYELMGQRNHAAHLSRRVVRWSIIMAVVLVGMFAALMYVLYALQTLQHTVASHHDDGRGAYVLDIAPMGNSHEGDACSLATLGGFVLTTCIDKDGDGRCVEDTDVLVQRVLYCIPVPAYIGLPREGVSFVAMTYL